MDRKYQKRKKEEKYYEINYELKVKEIIEYQENENGDIFLVKSNLILIYKDKSFDLNQLLPEGVIFYRRDVSSTFSFVYASVFWHPLYRENCKAVIYSDLSNIMRLYSLFHEIGHAVDFSKNYELYKGSKSPIELDPIKERRANAEALKIIRMLRKEGFLPEELFSNEFLYKLISAQLFRKRLEIQPGEYHPYLKRRLPEEIE